jgi:hypothetical protein
MITRHHLSLTLLCTLILCCAFFPGDLILAALVITGALAGSILPDIQMKKPSRPRSLTIAWYVTRFTAIICVPFMRMMYGPYLQGRFDPSDKRLTHSLPGIAFIFLYVALILFIPAGILGKTPASSLAGYVLGGAGLGLALHLVTDMCTRKGISPFFPFSTLRLKGSIRPCDIRNHRIAYFHMAAGLILSGMIALIVADPDGAGLLVPAGLAGFFAFMGIMILCSGIRMVTPDGGETDENSLAARPYSS